MRAHARVGGLLPDVASRVVFSSGGVESGGVGAFVERADITVLPKPYALTQPRRLLGEP